MNYILGILLCVLTIHPAHAADLSAAPLITLAGQTQHLSDYRGHYILMHFWASWCLPCLAEFPTLVKLATDLPNITVMAVSVDEDPKNAAKFLQKLAAAQRYPQPLNKIPNFVLLQDPQKQLSQDIFGSFQYPETILLNPQLQPVYKWTGPKNWSPAMMQQHMQPD